MWGMGVSARGDTYRSAHTYIKIDKRKFTDLLFTHTNAHTRCYTDKNRVSADRIH